MKNFISCSLLLFLFSVSLCSPPQPSPSWVVETSSFTSVETLQAGLSATVASNLVVSKYLHLNGRHFFVLLGPATAEQLISHALLEFVAVRKFDLVLAERESFQMHKSRTPVRPYYELIGLDRPPARPVLAVSLAPRMPNSNVTIQDPLFPQQWHLQNTGQSGGSPGADIRVAPAWQRGFTGKGTTVCIVDDGLERDHPDISPNFDQLASWNFLTQSANTTTEFPHGTSAGGVAGAASNNVCGVGAAYNAHLSAAVILGELGVSDSTEATALTYQNQVNQIYSNSWGPNDDGKGFVGPGVLVKAAFIDSTSKGRNGLGSIYVWAAGNGLENNDNANYDGYANSRYTIAVSACDNQGKQSYYSEPGACILVTAPSSGNSVGITTTDLIGKAGYSNSDCTDDFGGTSSACPLAAGAIALALQANPLLSWRDMMYVLVHSASITDPSDSDWKINGAGLWVNHKYGFGRVNASRAIEVASTWKSVPEVLFLTTNRIPVKKDVPDNGTALLLSFNVQHTGTLEHVEVALSLRHQHPSDLKIVLTSPSGTQSILSEPHGIQTLSNIYYGPLQPMKAEIAQFSANFTTLSGTLIIASPRLGCSTLNNGQRLSESILLIERGDCTFLEKAQEAQKAGAAGCIIFNNIPNQDPWSMGGDGVLSIPVVMISYEDGMTLLNSNGSSIQLATLSVKSFELPLRDWVFSTVHSWEESPEGVWQLSVEDLFSDGSSSSVGFIESWAMHLYCVDCKAIGDDGMEFHTGPSESNTAFAILFSFALCAVLVVALLGAVTVTLFEKRKAPITIDSDL